MAKKARFPKSAGRVLVEIYRTELYVARDKAGFAELCEWFGVSPDIEGLAGGVQWLKNKDTGLECGICGFFEDEIQPSTIAHECLHAAFYIADYVGVQRTDDEAMCYLLDYLVEGVTKFLNG